MLYGSDAIIESVRALRDLAAELKSQQPEAAQQLRQIATNLATPLQQVCNFRIEGAQVHPEAVPAGYVHHLQQMLEKLDGASEEEQAKANQRFPPPKRPDWSQPPSWLTEIDG